MQMQLALPSLGHVDHDATCGPTSMLDVLPSSEATHLSSQVFKTPILR
jgi:hypothetical protein